VQEIKSQVINSKKIHAFKSKDEFLGYIKNQKKILIALNAEKLIKCDEELNTIINENIGYPDGVGAVLALKRKGIQSVKIAGAEFWLDIVEDFSESKSFYLIGSSEEVIQKTVTKLTKEFENINIIGYRNGYLKSGDDKVLINEFIEKRPDVIFVAMGSPKQEFLMRDFMQEYKGLYMGLGGSFDVYSGTKKRAPKIFINLGLEWLYRLLKEPTRFSRQIGLVKFFLKILFDKKY
jgi:UDP-N-acetyl-D-mannosaminouronate:lipid I N-acetyl-D-mannosaminouronosyltransferase